MAESNKTLEQNFSSIHTARSPSQKSAVDHYAQKDDQLGQMALTPVKSQLNQDLSNQLTELKEKSEVISTNTYFKDAAQIAKQQLDFNKSHNLQQELAPMQIDLSK